MWDLSQFSKNVALVDAQGKTYSYAWLEGATQALATHVPTRSLVFSFCSNSVG